MVYWEQNIFYTCTFLSGLVFGGPQTLDAFASTLTFDNVEANGNKYNHNHIGC